MIRARRDWLALCACAVLSLPLPGRADDTEAQRAQAIQAVIDAQLQAFAADDAERAFSFASDAIRELFRNAERFMAMVRREYAVVYRPARREFIALEVRPAEVLQAVRLHDAQGAEWIAVYRMQEVAAGEWRINGCVLQRLPGTRA